MAATSTSEYGAHVADVMLRGLALGSQIGNAARNARIALQQQELAQQHLGLQRLQLNRQLAKDSWSQEMDTAKLAAENRRLDLMSQMYGTRAEDTASKIAEREERIRLAGQGFNIREQELEARVEKARAEASLAQERIKLAVNKGNLDERKLTAAEGLYTSQIAINAVRADMLRQSLLTQQETDPIKISQMEAVLQAKLEELNLKTLDASYAPLVMDEMDKYKRQAILAMTRGEEVPEFTAARSLSEVHPYIISTPTFQNEYKRMQNELAAARNSLPAQIRVEPGARSLENEANADATEPADATDLSERAVQIRNMAAPKSASAQRMSALMEQWREYQTLSATNPKEAEKFQAFRSPTKWGLFGMGSSGEFKLNEFKDSQGNLWVQSGPNSVRMVKNGRQQLALIKYQALMKSDLPNKAAIEAAERELEDAFKSTKDEEATKVPGIQPLDGSSAVSVIPDWNEFLDMRRMGEADWKALGFPPPPNE